MYFLYGYDSEHYVDITNHVFNKCLNDIQIKIPENDNVRAALFGDPYPGILKHILILDSLGNEHRVHANKEIIISFNSISEQLSLQSHPKLWYQKVGKNIENPLNRLLQLHKKLVLNHGTFQDEFPEQLLAIKFINPDSKILEIGGNIGRNTLIINSIVEDSKNIVTLESDRNIARELKDNLDENNFKSHIEASALSKIPLIQKGWNTVPLEGSVVPEGWSSVPTINYEELCKKYNIEFDTLVADCEGALYYILRDEPSLLTNIKLVIIENDFNDLEHKKFVDEQFKTFGLSRVFSHEGGWGPCKEFFYEVWRR